MAGAYYDRGSALAPIIHLRFDRYRILREAESASV
jgi:hypothetical protein